MYGPGFAVYIKIGLTKATRRSNAGKDPMPQVLPDEAMLFFYKHIILPWETGLKLKTGCWNVKKTQEALKLMDVQIQCVGSGQVEDAAEKQRASKQTNFIVFVGRKSQMKDLFKHLRNCAAHASISTTSARRGKTLYRFLGYDYKNSALAISGQLDLDSLKKVIGALVSNTNSKPLSNTTSNVRATR